MNNIKASSALKTADSNKSRQRGSVSKSSLSIMKNVKGFGSIMILLASTGKRLLIGIYANVQ